MPYGGNDPAEQAKRGAILQNIIKPAAEQCGYEAFIETEAGAGGHITKNIIRHIGDCDLVIADISLDNGNVFYELGISHVFHKGKTIMIAEDPEHLKFDIRNDKVVPYVYDLSKLDEDKAAIVTAIKEREKGGDDYEDSDVPLAYPTLPVCLADFIQGGGSKESDQIKTLSEKLTLANEENATLKNRLEGLGVFKEEKTFDIKEALAEEMYSGNQGLILLRKAAEKDPFDLEEFYLVLGKVLNARYHGITDYYEMANLCNEKDLPAARKMILEKAYSLNPSDEKCASYLIDFYSSYPDTQPKALEMANELIGLEYANGAPFISPEKMKGMSEKTLTLFLNSYLRARRFQEMLPIIQYLLANKSPYTVTLMENKALVQVNLGFLGEAGKTYDELFQIPEARHDADAHKFYSMFLDKMKKDDLEYEQDELAIAADPESSPYYMALAGDLMDDHFVRTERGIEKINAEEAARACGPFLWQAFLLQQNNAAVSEILNFAMRNKMNKFASDFKMWLQQFQQDHEPDMSDYNTYPLEYCLNLKIE